MSRARRLHGVVRRSFGTDSRFLVPLKLSGIFVAHVSRDLLYLRVGHESDLCEATEEMPAEQLKCGEVGLVSRPGGPSCVAEAHTLVSLPCAGQVFHSTILISHASPLPAP